MQQGRREQYILFFTLFQVMLGFGIMIPILPFFARELGANSVQMGLLVTVWAGAQFFVSPLWGAFSDRVGRRPVLLIGLMGYALTFGLIAVAQNIWLVMLARFLGGVLSAATIPTAQAYMADTSQPEERSSRMAVMGAAMNLGFIGGPTVGGILGAVGLGHRHVFFASMALALLNWVIAYFALPEPPNRRTGGARKGFSGLQAVRIALAGPQALLFLLAFGGSFGGSTMFSMLGYFLMDRLGAESELVTSIAFTIQGASAVVFQGLLVGWASHRFGDSRPVQWALLSGMGGMLALILARSFAVVVVGLVLVTLALSFVRPLISAMVSRQTKMEQGMTMGIQTSFDALGRTIAPTWAGFAYLWHDWAPFATAMAVYFIFYLWTRRAWAAKAAEPSTESA